MTATTDKTGTSAADTPIIDGLYCAIMTGEQLEKTRAGGVRAVNLTATMPNNDLSASMSRLAAVLRVVAENAERAGLSKVCNRRVIREIAVAVYINSQRVFFFRPDDRANQLAIVGGAAPFAFFM